MTKREEHALPGGDCLPPLPLSHFSPFSFWPDSFPKMYGEGSYGPPLRLCPALAQNQVLTHFKTLTNTGEGMKGK